MCAKNALYLRDSLNRYRKGNQGASSSSIRTHEFVTDEFMYVIERMKPQARELFLPALLRRYFGFFHNFLRQNLRYCGNAGELTKKYLKLATSEGFDVADLATKLEEGTFERKKPSAEASEVQGQVGQEIPDLLLIYDKVAAMEAAISKTVNIIKSEHAKIKKDADKSKLKAALKACIERIEEAYGLI